MFETCSVLQQNKIGIISASGWLFKMKFVILTLLVRHYQNFLQHLSVAYWFIVSNL